jgi:hypothetical protein
MEENQAPQASVEDIITFVKDLCLTYSQLAIYPFEHPTSQNQIQKAWDELQPVFQKFGNITISLAEGKLLFAGMPVEERNPAVAKFAKHFEALLIHTITFKKECSFDEFRHFFAVFCQESRKIVEEGGFQVVLEKENIKNIEFNAIVYRMINEDEKIVKKSEVYTGHVKKELADEEILKYFTERMLSLSQDPKELVDEIKNNPEKLAKQIITFVEHVGIGDDFDSGAMIESLLKNIHLVAENLSAENTEKEGETQTIAEAMVVLEQELAKKSKHLSSKDSIRFIKRITDVVASYTEKLKAEKVIGEFLRNEKSLKAAEKMMREISSSSESGGKILEKIKELMHEKGLSEDELIAHLEKGGIKKNPRAKPVKKSFNSAEEEVKNAIEHDFQEVKDKEKLLHYLDNIYGKEIKRLVAEKTCEIEKRTEKLQETLSKVHDVFEHTNIGIVVCDENENIIFADNQTHLDKNLKLGDKIPEKIKQDACAFSNPGETKINDSILWHVERGENPVKIRSILFQFEK